MPPIDQATILPNLLFGVLAVGIGIVVVLRRRASFRSTVRGLNVVSRVASRVVGRSSSPSWVGAAGAVFIGVGLLMIGAAVAGLIQLAA